MTDEQNGSRENLPSDVNTTGQQRRLGGITGKGFMRGQSGNPSGKNRSGLAALVRSRTKDGEVLVDLMYRIACGARFKTSRRAPDGTVLEVCERPSVGDRIEAIKWLSDRGWGRARDIVEVEGEARPFMIVLPGYGRDPLEEPETVEQAETKLPALPAQMPEIGVDLNLEDLGPAPHLGHRPFERGKWPRLSVGRPLPCSICHASSIRTLVKLSDS